MILLILMPTWLSGDSTSFVRKHTNIGSSILSVGTKFDLCGVNLKAKVLLCESIYVSSILTRHPNLMAA